jgi:uncharacterized radical SAM protein YgiQ
MFLPTTKKELETLGWDRLDVILVSGDSYIDSPHIGISVIGHILSNAGYRVGIIAQPDINSPDDITRLGEPGLFWGVSAGAVDSMVANYTASKKPRKQDDYTPGGINNRRPDRAVLVYTNLIRRYYKNTTPIVLGGIEASLRRIAHYDYWSNKIRGSILFDSKADYLLYGMADTSVLQLAEALAKGKDISNIRGLAYKSVAAPENCVLLPSLEEVSNDKLKFIQSYKLFYNNNDPFSGKILAQKHDARFLIQNPPSKILAQQEMDEIYGLPFERRQHPYYEAQGKVKALETIQFSITTHRGCYGECNFCAIAVHEGRIVQWRSETSVLNEIKKIAAMPEFKGYITDLGGPTANMYGYECSKKLRQGVCHNKRCLFPSPCLMLKIDHHPLISLMQKARKIPGVKKIFIGSGIRYDLLQHDPGSGSQYLQDLCEFHISGQLKVAPEHDSPKVLALMGKPGKEALIKFRDDFNRINTRIGKNQFLTYYFIAAHPGCTVKDMMQLKKFVSNELKITPEQVQIFTPTPSTWSTVMYATETDPFTMEHIFVEKDPVNQQKQKNIVLEKELTKQWPKRS